MRVSLTGIMSLRGKSWLKAPWLINGGFREENVRVPRLKDLRALKQCAWEGHLPADLVSWHEVHCTQNAASGLSFRPYAAKHFNKKRVHKYVRPAWKAGFGTLRFACELNLMGLQTTFYQNIFFQSGTIIGL